MFLEAFGRLFGLCAGTAVLTYLLTGILADKNWVTNEVSERSNHKVPTSRAGGIVIVMTTFVVLWVMHSTGAFELPTFAVIAICASVLGSIDDVSPVPARQKLITLILLSILSLLATGPIPNIPLPFYGSIPLPNYIAYPLSAFIILAFVNAFNFMDGLNGMAGSVGLVGIGLMIFVSKGEVDGTMLIAVILGAAVYGFLVRNVMTGKIFLGDAGSLGIGMFLVGCSMDRAQTNEAAFSIFAIAFVPYFLDTGLTLLRRWRAGKSLTEPHKEHFYQQLRDYGWSHQSISLAYMLLTLASGATAIAGHHFLGALGLWLALLTSVAMYITTLARMFQNDQDRLMTEQSASSSSKFRNVESGATERA